MRKKSSEVAFARLTQSFNELRAFLTDAAGNGLNAHSIARCHDFATISTYRAFEEFVLAILVAQINKDPSHLYESVGVNFGTNPTAAQCEYLLVGDRYFDFRGHSGLVEFVKKVSPKNSKLESAVKDPTGRQSFEILVGLRNYVAHGSDQSKAAALKAMKHWEPTRKNLGSAGQWLRVRSGDQTRMERLLTALTTLAKDMKDAVK